MLTHHIPHEAAGKPAHAAVLKSFAWVLAAGLTVATAQAQQPAPAQPSEPSSAPAVVQPNQPATDLLAHKVAADLRLAIDAAKPTRQPWLRESAGQRWVRVVVTGQRLNAELAEARKFISERGGHVVAHDVSIATVVAVLPAAQVRALAARPEVLHVAPDRTMEAAAKAPPATTVAPHLAAYGLAPNSARAISDKALLGE